MIKQKNNINPNLKTKEVQKNDLSITNLGMEKSIFNEVCFLSVCDLVVINY
jgi:hypothetical protein